MTTIAFPVSVCENMDKMKDRGNINSRRSKKIYCFYCCLVSLLSKNLSSKSRLETKAFNRILALISHWSTVLLQSGMSRYL